MRARLSYANVDVRDGSLGAVDFAAGQLPAGAAGPKGDAGPAGAKGDPGAKGEPGSPDTPAQVLGKLATVDGAGSGVDADTLDGISSAGLVNGAGSVQKGQAFRVNAVETVPVLTGPDYQVRMICSAGAISLDLVNTAVGDANAVLDDGSASQRAAVVDGGGGVMQTRVESQSRQAGAGLMATWSLGAPADGPVTVINASAYRDTVGANVCFARSQAVRTS